MLLTCGICWSCSCTVEDDFFHLFVLMSQWCLSRTWKVPAKRVSVLSVFSISIQQYQAHWHNVMEGRFALTVSFLCWSWGTTFIQCYLSFREPTVLRVAFASEGSAEFDDSWSGESLYVVALPCGSCSLTTKIKTVFWAFNIIPEIITMKKQNWLRYD